jgi:hypothetical protein
VNSSGEFSNSMGVDLEPFESGPRATDGRGRRMEAGSMSSSAAIGSCSLPPGSHCGCSGIRFQGWATTSRRRWVRASDSRRSTLTRARKALAARIHLYGTPKRPRGRFPCSGRTVSPKATRVSCQRRETCVTLTSRQGDAGVVRVARDRSVPIPLSQSGSTPREKRGCQSIRSPAHHLRQPSA